jgi:putative oxidoreductase
MGLATTTLRIGLGGLMAGHGLQKLAGKFGGAGLDGTAQGFEAMGFRPGRPYATAAGAAETVGGSLLAAGMWTPLGAAMLTGAMGTAIAKVHAKNGPWVTKGGFEYNAVIIAAAFAITEAGPGFPAVDGLITKRRKGFGWAVAELALGLAGTAAVLKLNERGADVAGAVDAATTGPAATVIDTTHRLADRVSAAADTVAGKSRAAAESVAATAEHAGSAAQRAGDSAGDKAAQASHATSGAAAAATNGSKESTLHGEEAVADRAAQEGGRG